MIAPRRRVAITGLAVVSPLGLTVDELWAALAGRRSGVGPYVSFSPENLPAPFAAEIANFTGAIDDFGPLEAEQKKAIRKGTKLMCRECQMGVAAAMRALGDARLPTGSFDPERIGIVYGTDYMLSLPQEFNSGMALCATPGPHFQYSRWGNEGMRQMSPLWLLKYLPNMPACHLAIYHDLRGPNNSLTSREAAANLAVAEAYRTIERGAADIMIAGATGTRVHVMKTLHSHLQEEVAAGDVEPARASRPFDRHRSGMVLGEGSAAPVLEELGAAQARGATLYGEVLGGSSSSVAAPDGVARRDRALANAMRAALAAADYSPDDVGHIHAHGLSTRSSDIDEARAIGEVFGSRASQVPVVAAKSNFGNLGAGSGAVELVASVAALNRGRLFSVLNYETPDPACPLAVVRSDDVPAGESCLNLSVTPQGQASCVLVRKLG